mmetsp:Transcript_3460/g.5010  ORF Transcript_3460/g.5010 Transcript_3460/m.5010 type:complete len:362 (-) Transcript_3460:136-1221(-)|eukprot:CAMPEP_0203677614 /NCGR_PEP_ID=MMETSP0090-20130426/28834_1 /ASSEMBLY_ACC=CAM_ASM_001088 /TAXON_ID=426623 /ORGANISM="Chaetoceros affinis, Strain CCMP159" /LENGTH=361 /DNA_ID=CAMNT_0050544561 /DNA_START=273 /DNA_END=1358 /DNA_ORIENTATION=+
MEKPNEEGTQRRGKLPQEVKNIVAGGLAGMVAKTIVAPVDRIKILYQVTSTPFYLRDVPGVVSSIVREEGFQALWKGNMATMIRIFPYAGIQFMVFNKLKSYLISLHHDENDDGSVIPRNNSFDQANDRKWDLSPVESLLAGSTAGAVSVLFTYPLDLTRAQLAVLKKQKTKKSDGFITVLFGNYTKWGFGGLFRGISPTLLGILPYSGIAFTINEQAKRQIYKIKGRDPITIEKVQCGALSGLIAQSMTYPLEVTRRRMQTIGVVPTSGKDAAVDILGTSVETKPAQDVAKLAEKHIVSKPPTMYRIMKQVMREQGLKGFFKGLSMNWLKGPVGFSISFTTFDLLKEWIDQEEERWISNR